MERSAAHSVIYPSFTFCLRFLLRPRMTGYKCIVNYKFQAFRVLRRATFWAGQNYEVHPFFFGFRIYFNWIHFLSQQNWHLVHQRLYFPLNLFSLLLFWSYSTPLTASRVCVYLLNVCTHVLLTGMFIFFRPSLIFIVLIFDIYSSNSGRQTKQKCSSLLNRCNHSDCHRYISRHTYKITTTARTPQQSVDEIQWKQTQKWNK